MSCAVIVNAHRYSLQKDPPELAEREAWNERESERWKDCAKE